MAHNGTAAIAMSSVGAGARSTLAGLESRRPDTARTQNEYIDTPLRSPPPPASTAPPPPLPAKTSLKQQQQQASLKGSFFFDPNSFSPITNEPKSSFKKECVPSTDDLKCLNVPEKETTEHADTIQCRRCGKCRCYACQTPKRLPSRWLCNNKVDCSSQSLVEYCSCVCCVKGVFYHWAKDYDLDSDVSCADKPCSCGPHRLWARWSCMGLMSIFMPCLCLYWPLKACANSTEWCYTSWTSRRGCRCSEVPPSTQQPVDQGTLKSTKRLLDTSPT